MQWSPSLSVGDVRIDDQHQQLFHLLESLENTPADQSLAQAQAAISVLQRFVKEHLRDEEAMLRSFNYKDYGYHCALHHEFEEKLASLVGRLATEDHYIVLQDLRAFVQSWLVEHISVADLRYKPYILS